MVQLIVGAKGKGKTKHLLDRVNESVKKASGNVVYLDKSTKHMFELDKKVRLINVAEFPISGTEGFLGFVCGIVSQDHDLEEVYFDSFLKIAHLEESDAAGVLDVINKLDKLSGQYNVSFCISISKDEADLPEGCKDKIVVSL